MNPQRLVAAVTRCCSKTSSGVRPTPAKKTPARSKKPNSSTRIGTAGERSSRSRATVHSYCSWPVLPRNCSVICQDSGADQRRPSALERSRSETVDSSSITAAASGIPAKRRIPESVGPTPHALRDDSINQRASQEKALGSSECALSPRRPETKLLDPPPESRSGVRSAEATPPGSDC